LVKDAHREPREDERLISPSREVESPVSRRFHDVHQRVAAQHADERYRRDAIDEGTEFGARVARRLREEIVVWLTTVTPAGTPLPRPVGFVRRPLQTKSDSGSAVEPTPRH
jgi:hypothetical protein